MADKVALITGATGQDGAYLAEFLLGKVTSSMEWSGGRHRLTLNASIISTLTRMSRMRGSTCTMAI
jgi:GDP-D-mannose dehydratase